MIMICFSFADIYVLYENDMSFFAHTVNYSWKHFIGLLTKLNFKKNHIKSLCPWDDMLFFFFCCSDVCVFFLNRPLKKRIMLLSKCLMHILSSWQKKTYHTGYDKWAKNGNCTFFSLETRSKDYNRSFLRTGSS